MKEFDKFYKKMSELSDEKLHEIIAISFEDYTDAALDAARAVLEERGIKVALQGEAKPTVNLDQLTSFNDCIQAVDYAGVEIKLGKLFKESDKSLAAYKSMYSKLMRMKPAKFGGVYIFVAQIREDIRAGYPFDVFGVEKGSTEHFGLEMFPWNEWLSFKIYEKSKGFILNLGLEEFVAICLKKMTSLGMTEEEIEERIAELQDFEGELFNSSDKIEV